MPINVQDPPAIYDHMPSKPIVRQQLPLEKVNKICRELITHPELVPAGQTIFACTTQGTEACFTLMAKIDYKVIDPNDQMRIVRHENAHCNGWTPDHPGASPYRVIQVPADEVKALRAATIPTVKLGIGDYEEISR